MIQFATKYCTHTPVNEKKKKKNSIHLYELAFVAGSQLLNVTHGLIWRNQRLFFTRPQQWQVCKTKEGVGGALFTQNRKTALKINYHEERLPIMNVASTSHQQFDVLLYKKKIKKK